MNDRLTTRQPFSQTLTRLSGVISWVFHPVYTRYTDLIDTAHGRMPCRPS